jgi:polyribonucleotide nucleotidyltransferase
VTANVLCADGVHDTEVLAINAASAALAVSPLPWAGPIGAVRVAVGADGDAHVEPAASGQAAAAPRLRLLVAGTRSRVVLLEAEV